MKVVVCKGGNIAERTRKALEVLSPTITHRDVLIKPNLVEPMQSSTGAVTRPEVVKGIIEYLGEDYNISIGESSAGYDTGRAFNRAGYGALEREKVKLIDFDDRGYIRLDLDGRSWKQVEVTEIVRNKYLISAAVLKEHMFGVTLTLKNMMGILKPKGAYPNKSYIHRGVSEEIWAERLCDLLGKIKPDLAVIDGTTGMYGSHIHGTLKQHDLTIVSEDPVAADIAGSQILGQGNVLHLLKALARNIGEKPEVIELDI